MKKRAGTSQKRTGKKGSKWFRGNIPVVMLWKLLIILGLMFFSRILFYLFNLGYFSNLTFSEAIKIFIVGIRFDISAILIINTPFILMNIIPFKFRTNKWYQGVANGWFYLISSIGLMGNFIDTIYFRFTLKRQPPISSATSESEVISISLFPSFFPISGISFWSLSYL